MRFAGYGRNSTDKQNPTSPLDQLHEIREAGEAKGWVFVRGYTDTAVSGFSEFGRDAFAEMKRDAEAGLFDCIIIEDLDRLSRNIGDAAKFKEKMDFLGIAIYSLSKGGFVNELDIGFKGTMNAQFLKDLSQKTKRGLAASVRKGKSAGGLPYGYKNTAEPGIIVIDEPKAEVVRRIFQMYADGHSPRSIAGALNSDGVPSPRGGDWNASTINGHRSRGVGILRNTIYIGRRVWRRTCKVRNPDTGQRLIRTQSEENHITVKVPHLRILKKNLWDSVQARLPNRRNNKPYPKRSAYLLSGLMECGECGSPYTAMGGGKHARFGCSAR